MHSLSPDGRHCALAVVDGDSQQIIHWQDGRRVATVRLPCRGILAHLYVLDSGVIYAWVPSAPIGSVYRIEGGRLAARGTVATLIAQGYPLGRFSSDGRAFITADNSGFVYHRVSMSGATLNLTPVYTAKEPAIKTNNHNLPYLVNADLLVATNGAVYTGRGKVSDSSGWQCFAYESNPPCTALMQYRLPSSMKSPLDAIAVRVFDPHTRTHWTPADGTSHLVSAVTPDGRFALVGRQPARRFRAFVKTMAAGKHLPSRVRTPLQRYLNRDEITLTLYERPGRARATLHLSFGETSLPVIRHDGAQYLYQQLNLSPDGHTLRIIGHHDMSGEKRIFTYAW
ncbi:MAG: hypothetical protein ACYDCO_18980 [Armatimonadota bacterium]